MHAGCGITAKARTKKKSKEKQKLGGQLGRRWSDSLKKSVQKTKQTEAGK